jgi:thioredoxin
MIRVTALAAAAWLLFNPLLQAQEPRGIVYDFSATWCGPCQQMAPIVEKLQREGLSIRKVDVDQEQTLTSQFKVSAMPTFVLVIDGKEADRRVGRMTESDLRRMISAIPTTTSGNKGHVSSSRGSVIPVELGEPGPIVRPQPMQTADARAAQPEQKPGLRDLIPFGKKEKESTPAVVRGNDSDLTSDPRTMSHEDAIDPMQASVRIRVITNGRIDLGSGTVISSRAGISQILTCAHIFKEFGDDSRIEVDVFDHGRATQYLARLKKFDKDSDVGLIEIPTAAPVAATLVAAVEEMPRVGEPVAAIGCSGGEEPTRQQSRVTDIDKYEGPHNLLCTGVPVRGRSGGGLFNRHGAIIGVCSAADEEQQRGFYSGLKAIHKLLDDCSLAHLYKTETPASPVASQPAQALASQPAAGPFDSAFAALENNAPAAAPAAPQTAAATQAFPPAAAAAAGSSPMDVQAGDAEVVVIIRDRNQPQSQNRVVILHQASPKFLSYLSGELQEDTLDSSMLGTMGATSTLPRGLQTAPRGSTVETAKQILQPTTLSQPVMPHKYIRQASAPAGNVH